MLAASSNYKSLSSRTFVDSLIPQEVAFIKPQQVELLKTCNNLTISFDGQTTASLQSIYTIHVITLDRRVFLMKGNEASDAAIL